MILLYSLYQISICTKNREIYKIGRGDKKMRLKQGIADLAKNQPL